MRCKCNLFLIVVLLIGGILPLSAQLDLSVTAIPDSLKKNAYTVTRFDDETVEINTLISGVRKDSYAITVLNEKGEALRRSW